MKELTQFIIEGREQDFVAFEFTETKMAVVGRRANGETVVIDGIDLFRQLDLNSPGFKELFEKAIASNPSIQHGWYQTIFAK